MSGPKPRDFWSVVAKSEGCWLWNGFIGPTGYGVVYTPPPGPDRQRAHRVAYELLIGPIPDGLVLDHLCRNRACVNPSHLEPVTNAENLRRGAASRTHCLHGHERTETNSYVDSAGKRRCRPCARRRARAYKARKRQAVAA